jgi:hypothetical protein
MINKTTISKNDSSFEPIPADLYQVQILDVNEVEGTAYMSTKKIMQFQFKLAIVEGEFKDRVLFLWTSQTWFSGSEGKATKPSKLFTLIKTINSYYYKDINTADIEEITEKEINNLIEKQIRITVEITDNNKNKIISMTPIKKEIPYKSEIEIENPLDEDVDPDDIPI